MVLFGALIALDSLPFWPTVFFAVCGAISGDSLSYWLGRRYQNRIITLWPLSRHPAVIVRANQFIDQHGVKSILLSRFIGPLRPIIPAIAGITNMPVKIFIAVNVSSAFVWAPVYLLPGIIFGLSVEIASEFASKFLFLIVLLLFTIIFSVWLVQRLYLLIKPYNDQLVSNLLKWGQKHPLAGQVPASIFDQTQSELRGLSLLALFIFISTLLIYLLLNSFFISDYIFSYNLESLDRFIYYGLQKFRSPPLDSLMLWFSYITSSTFIALLYFFWGTLFIYRNNFSALWHWLAAISLPLLISPLLVNDLTTILQNNLDTNIQSLPSIAIVSVVGFTAILINSGQSLRRQILFSYFSVTLVLLLSLAQLYLALQVFSQVLFSFFIGSLWFSLLGIAYRRHTRDTHDKKIKKEFIFILFMLLCYPIIKTVEQAEIQTSEKHYFVIGRDSWLESGWSLLPLSRESFHNNENNRFNLQWSGTKENITVKLEKYGFIQSIHFKNLIPNWFIQDVAINELPLLPHIHNGEYESVRFYQFNKKRQSLTVIRLWQSHYQLRQDSPEQPLWFGSISTMETKSRLGLKYLVTKNEGVQDISRLFQDEELLLTSKMVEVYNKKHRLLLLY